jgi:hypothetical protein
MAAHVANWYWGWSLILAAFVSGAGIGLFFHRPDFLGGYDSFRRRLLRLGHIALAALGMMNVLYGLSPWPTGPDAERASLCFIAGGVAMPVVCFLTAWEERFRHAFCVPVTALVLAAWFTLRGGTS